MIVSEEFLPAAEKRARPERTTFAKRMLKAVEDVEKRVEFEVRKR